MVGTTVTTTDGKTTFIVQSCEFCNLDTGGNHESDCPYCEVDFKRYIHNTPVNEARKEAAMIYREDNKPICLDCVHKRDPFHFYKCDKEKVISPYPMGCKLFEIKK